MYDFLTGFPEQCRKAWQIIPNRPLKLDNFSCRQILCIGVGGSGIGAEVVRSLISKELKVPMLLCRHYQIPAFVDSQTLVVATSYSGDTEETLTAYRQAAEQGAMRVAVGSGGQVEVIAHEEGVPFIKVPESIPPRMALGYLSFPLLRLLQDLGWIRSYDSDVDETVRLLDRLFSKYRLESEPPMNLAKEIALQMHHKIPVMYSGNDGMESVLLRWKGLLNENSKIITHGQSFPEASHNEIQGWQFSKDLIERSLVLFLKDKDDYLGVQEKMAVFQEMLEKMQVQTVEVRSQGRSLMSRLFSLIYLGDFISYYLALENGVDPVKIDMIDYLKRVTKKE